ncbi:zonadhesin-like [Ptychodera flava]|uniref:zonadhesin-like n=1 Tax=Ptychodera flava TaxID=63121 RepID=UPI003969C71D
MTKNLVEKRSKEKTQSLDAGTNMKLLFVVAALVVIHSTLVKGASYYREKRDTCSVGEEAQECLNNPGVSGTCRSDCPPTETEATDGQYLCRDRCVCCTPLNTGCSEEYHGGYCSAGPCEDGLQSIYDHDLCGSSYTCCKHKAVSTAHQGDRNNAQIHHGGEKGIGTHFTTFDGYKFRFQGLCTYVLVKDKTNKLHPRFHVHALHVMANDDNSQLAAYTSAIEIRYGKDYIVLRRNLAQAGQVVEFNNKQIQDKLPFKNNDLQIEWGHNQRSVSVDLEGILKLEFNGKGKTEITMDDSQEDTVWGILGNNNGDHKDDLTFPLKTGGTTSLEVKPASQMSKEDFINFFTGWLVTCDKDVWDRPKPGRETAHSQRMLTGQTKN